MISSTYEFDKPCLMTEAIITAVRYDRDVYTYELSLLGIGDDGFSYTNPGKMWLDEDDLRVLMREKELEFPQELCGMRVRIIADGYKESD